MKSKLLSLVLILPLIVSVTSEGRGGFGGGGRMGGSPGGGFRPSRPSAPATRPARPTMPSPGPRPGTLPAKGPSLKPGPRPIGPGTPGAIKPRPGTLPAAPGGKPGIGDVGKFLGGAPPGHFPGTPGHRPGFTGYHKAEFHQNIYGHFPYHPAYGYPFGRGWCDHIHWHYHNWPIWTAAATGAALTTWIGAPAYAGYGSSQAVAYYPVEQAPVETYEEQVTAPASAVEYGKATEVSDDAELLNLGTFGVIPNGEKDMAYGLQLTTTKEGIVRGLQWNMKDNTFVEVKGSIEKESLRISWQGQNAGDPYFETNVDQLTQQESYVNVYNPTTKVLISWQLIQIDEKDLPPKP